jgi:hypothetical protein
MKTETAINKYTPEIAEPVESFKNAFNRIVQELLDKEESISPYAKKELWCLFEGFYVNVLCSMHGWKSCVETERRTSKKLFHSLVDMTNLYIENSNLRPDDYSQKEYEKYQIAVDVMRLSGLTP